MSICFKHNTASQSEILHHLQRVSSAFVQDLSQRVSLEEYSLKLFSLAEREEAWLENELIGLVAYYINRDTQKAFITNVSVDLKCQNRGVATKLIGKATDFSSEKSMKMISLEVACDENLLNFYTKLGFIVNRKNTNFIELNKYLSPVVAIRCTVFNHEPYLRDCLEGFVMQQTNFPFVAIVHDDASTEGSVAIIREYEEKYPDIIKPIYETENQYSKHDGSLGRIMSAAIEATGAKYVAMCEGDDYWTDPLKLQRQVDFMEADSNYSMCTENSLVVFSDGLSRDFSDANTRDVTMEELLFVRQFHTSSVLMRASLFSCINKLDGPKFDTFIWAFMAQHGKVHYENIISSVYRRGPGITETDKVRWAYLVETYNNNMYDKLNIPHYIIKKRNKTQVVDCFNGFLAAKEQKKYKIALDLLIKCFKYDAKFFLKSYVFLNVFCRYKSIKNKIKQIIKK